MLIINYLTNKIKPKNQLLLRESAPLPKAKGVTGFHYRIILFIYILAYLLLEDVNDKLFKRSRKQVLLNGRVHQRVPPTSILRISRDFFRALTQQFLPQHQAYTVYCWCTFFSVSCLLPRNFFRTDFWYRAGYSVSEYMN